MATTYKTIIHNGYNATIAYTNNQYGTCYIKSIKGPDGRPCSKDTVYTGTANDFRHAYGPSGFAVDNNQPAYGHIPNMSKPEATVCWLIDNYLRHNNVGKALVIEAWDAKLEYLKANRVDDGICY